MRKPKPLSLGRKVLLAFGAVVMGWGLPTVVGGRPWFRANNPTAVTVRLTAPMAGMVVSNNIQLAVLASSTAAPIARVEFYCDGKLISIVNSNNQPIPLPPGGMKVE